MVAPPTLSGNDCDPRHFERALLWKIWSNEANWSQTAPALAQAVAPHLWENWGNLLPLADDENYEKIGEVLSLTYFLLPLESGAAARRILGAIEKRKGRKYGDLRQRLETALSRYFGGDVVLAGLRSPIWKLESECEPVLRELEARRRTELSKARKPRNDFQRSHYGLGPVAVGFYRLDSEAGRGKSLELLRETPMSSSFLMNLAKENLDAELWLELIISPWHPDEQALFYPAFKAAKPNETPALIVEMIEKLGQSSDERTLKIVAAILGTLAPAELGRYGPNIAQHIESPMPKVAKWALETLLKLRPANWDWPRAIEGAGDKLWSENMGLAKIAARFLGEAPAEFAGLAWKQLEAALALENLILREAILRALVKLRKTDGALQLDEMARQEMEELAKLAPERFGKFVGKF